jgi:hypothetical protein
VPSCIDCDLNGIEACTHIEQLQWLPYHVNDAEFASNNRVFCDFLHRRVLHPELAAAVLECA